MRPNPRTRGLEVVEILPTVVMPQLVGVQAVPEEDSPSALRMANTAARAAAPVQTRIRSAAILGSVHGWGSLLLPRRAQPHDAFVVWWRSSRAGRTERR